MKFSVIVPTYNRRKLLEGCLKSILEQDYPIDDYEIIVVDDGSTDDTAQYLKTMKRIRYMRSERKGAGGARNIGLAVATGKYIAFTDDDCVVPKDWLKKLEKEYDNGVDAVGGSITNPTNSYIAWAQYYLNFSAWMPEMKKRLAYDIPTANVSYRRELIEDIKFPEITGGVYEDSIFNMEYLMSGKKLLFEPKIRVIHKTWDSNLGLHKFFMIQKKSAIGFVKGGYKVHNVVGRFLIDYNFLNLFNPRIICIAGRCLPTRHVLRFLATIPLIFAGEWYKGLEIIRNRKIRI